MLNTFKNYYSLTKPGIIYGNLITALGGFFLASKGHIRIGLLIATLLGVSLVIGSACVFNNYIDRNIDKLMSRTKKRLIATGSISPKNALTYGTVLGILGILSLGLFVNILTLAIGLIAFFVYVVLYGISKRKSVHGTVVGSIAGAAPIVAGYCAVSNHFGFEALLLFFVLVFWQMPHFYAIAMYRLEDYKAAKIPVLPIIKGMRITKIEILIYVALFTLANVLMTLFGYTGVVYLIIMLAVGGYWFWMGIKGFETDSVKWARRMFGLSLIIILIVSAGLAFNNLLT